MGEYKCIRCGYEFILKADLKRHYNRKKICDAIESDIPYNICLANIQKKENQKIKQLQEQVKQLEDENKILRKQSTNTQGYLYILYNNSFELYGKSVYKIGTSKDPERRKKDFSTICLTESNLMYVSTLFHNGSIAEKKLFETLDKYRCCKKREFFDVELEEAIKCIKELELIS
jgi:phage terminase large subunit GpA-like protein